MTIETVSCLLIDLATLSRTSQLTSRHLGNVDLYDVSVLPRFGCLQ